MATHVERSIEVEVPVRTAYDQWTQFEEFPRFMTGVQEVRQIGDALTHWVAEIGGVRREWDAAILEQIPDQKVAWAATTGATNAGAVFFTAVGEDRTMVRLTLDYEPEGLVERVADFFDVIDRQAVADLDRFKEFVESTGSATGGWRGRVDEGDVVSAGPTGSAGLGAAGVGVATAGMVGGAGPADAPPTEVDRNAGVGATGLATGGPSADEATGDVLAVGPTGGTSTTLATDVGTTGPTTYPDAETAPALASSGDGPGADEVQGDVLAVGPTGRTASTLATDTGTAGAPGTYGGADTAPGAARTVDDGPGADEVQGDVLAVGPTGGTSGTLTTEPGPAQVSPTAGAGVGDELGGDPVGIDAQHPLAGAGDRGTGGPTADAARASSGVVGFGTDTGLSSDDPASGAVTGSPDPAASGLGHDRGQAARADSGLQDATTDPVGESWSGEAGDPAGEPARTAADAQDAGWSDASGTDPVGESWSDDDGGTTSTTGSGTTGTNTGPRAGASAVDELGPAADPRDPHRPTTGPDGAR